MQKITPFLWYSKEAEEAAAFYASIFPDSRVSRVTALPSESPSGPPGSVKVVEFVLFGQPFIAMSAGPLDPFNHAVSFVVNCDDQAELDRYWNALLGRLCRAVRLAERSLRPLVADRPDRSRRDDGRARSSQGEAGVGRDDADGQDRHRCVAGGICGNDGGARAGLLMPEILPCSRRRSDPCSSKSPSKRETRFRPGSDARACARMTFSFRVECIARRTCPHVNMHASWIRGCAKSASTRLPMARIRSGEQRHL
jgi:uncharacterized glyoxalase superfamily protein PhnB